MVALGSGLTVSIDPSVLSDLRSAASAEEKLAVLGVAACHGTAALTDEGGVVIQSDCVKPFGDGN